MTVGQLIWELNKVEDKSMDVYYYDADGREYILVNRIELKDKVLFKKDEPINIIEII